MASQFDTSEFGWPERAEIFHPRSSSRRVVVDLIDTRVGNPLRKRGAEVEVGTVPTSLATEASDAPLAMVCEFKQTPTRDHLDLAHRLAWNLCRSRLLVTIDRRTVVAWSCCLPPDDPQRIVFDSENAGLQETALHALHWISLSSGEFFRSRATAFRPEGKADAWLLRNLRHVRSELLQAGLPKEICHDLLARLIFVQFLFHRTDKSGKPFIDENLLKQRFEGSVKEQYSSLAEILQNHDDTYRLFHWLNRRFNGDLFPAESRINSDGLSETKNEQNYVQAKHLRLLADFVSGNLLMKGKQRTLWPLYSFDTIPLEFISCVYEQFVSEDAHRNKAYYTRSHLVDYVLDNVLPWDSTEWDLRILDPCCGSGIFLVKAFQRLIHRWRNAHGGASPSVPDLKPILTDNLFGVDTDREAIRVASFSLYLAMCDAIDPRHYWKQTVLPPLRGRNLVHADFFQEDVEGIRTVEDANTYHFVLGNAPWGKNTVRKAGAGAEWAKRLRWPVAYNDIGPLFLAKAGQLRGTMLPYR